jgi:hypothetical protein
LQICSKGQTQNCICPSGSSNWCVGWNGQSFSPAYDQSATSELIKWTGDNTCQNPNGNTSSTSNQKWYNQSIVEDSTGTGSFQYPNTNMQAWLCASVASGTPSVNQNTPQGWLFYQQVANAEAQSLNLAMTAVQTCNGAEGFTGGTIMAGQYNNDSGLTAVETDMASDASHTGKCPVSPSR